MKRFKMSMAVMLAIAVATFSAFTTKHVSSKKTTTYYFANVNKANPPGTNDYLFKGTTDPTASHCDAGVPICYGSSSMGPDANNHPSGGAGSVTSLHSGNWHN